MSADILEALEVQEDLYDKNRYVYCDNNPIMRVDIYGAIWHLVVGAAVGVATQFVADVGIGLMSGSSIGEVMGSLSAVDYVSAAVGGALAASGISAVGAIAANAALGGTTYLANCGYKGEKANVVDLGAATVVGGIAGKIGGSGVNGRKLRGIYRRANDVIKTAKSARRIAKYVAKKTAIKVTVKSGVKQTVKAGFFSNITNFVRKLFTKSRV